ncbi:elongation factor 1-beta' [Neodiprion pinetum]|uniref:elongation factor 1-beta' n=1 Tax=Neodiprion fabricii TaxID=2872261 RepID=UPI001ED8C0AF|nr:elongation factor 1-beta' [Neodiprion fabricii]XP_046473801.1 elongation factor 1-beta' [Neodiprion pinetum]XP_046613849.1 elongation factor 1-beta' [Neodiprion virginianus]
MAIGDLKTDKGLKELNRFLADRSYIEGWQPSQADVAVFEALGNAALGSNPHVQRWYTHIKSYEHKSLPGVKKAPSILGGTETAPPPKAAKPADDDDDVDLFGSDEEEDAEAAKVREERLKAYAEKKSKKPTLIAKSSIVLDVKPWDDETDMKEMEKHVRSISMDGLVWGASKLVPVGYGINKLQIMCVVEDDKVSVDLLVEEIQNFEDFVQSVDIAAFNKI